MTQLRPGSKKLSRAAASSTAALAINTWTPKQFLMARAQCSTGVASPQSELPLFTLPNPMQSRLTKYIARKARLGGAAQISLDKYPRIVFTVEFTLQKTVDLTMKPLARGMAPIRDKCLAIDDITWSQQLGDLLVRSGVDGLLFPSAIGSGLNLIVYNQCCAPDALRLQSKRELLAKLKKIATAVP
jgi:RES domain